jgi:hypothetical protein
MLIPVDSMTPAQQEGWHVLLDLCESFPDRWCIIGGQMVWLLAYEYGVEPIRATEDVDVVVDIRADQRLLMRMCAWLESHDFDLEGINTDGIGHRCVTSAGCVIGHCRRCAQQPGQSGRSLLSCRDGIICRRRRAGG